MSAAQFALFKQAGKPRAKGAPRVQRRRDAMPENQLEGQICGFLRARNWQVSRQHVGTFVPYRVLMAFAEKRMTLEQAKRNIIRVGEKGAADWHALRVPHSFFFEVKAPSKVPTPEQLTWLERKRWFGTPAEWFSSFEAFQEWYRRMFGGK
jgi:hypothetical protein